MQAGKKMLYRPLTMTRAKREGGRGVVGGWWWVRHPYKIIPLSGTASVLHVVFTQSFYHQQNGRGGLFVLLWQYSRASQPATSFSCLGVDVVVGVGNLGHFPLPLMSSHIINEQFLMKSFMLWIFNIPSLVVVVGMEWLRYSTTWIGPYLGCDSMPRFMHEYVLEIINCIPDLSSSWPFNFGLLLLLCELRWEFY